MNALTQLTAFLVVLALSASSVVQSPAAKGQNFELLILHNNDMHARFEQTSQLSGTCTTADRDAGKCYGGFPRVAYVVKEARKAAASGEGPPVLYLNAGDTYTGTAWFTIYKWKIAAEFINALQPDAVSLGNHEFDDGVAGLTPFIRNLTAPVVAANLLLDNAPELETEPNLHKSIIILIENTKIGIIGYLTPTTKFLAKKNEVEYEDEIFAIKREVETLKNEGVNIFIALGHSGYIRDIEIAKNVDDIDLVIGGHSHTYLGKPIDGETDVPQGPYPTMVSQPSGRRVPVVQAYAFTKYLGKLHMIFDSEGEIIECDGIPLLLDHEIPNDPELQNVIVQYENEMKKINDELLGQSLVPLDGDCRLAECNMGNLITDAVLEYTALYHPEISDLNIALLHSGTIRTSIDHHEKPVQITRGELFMVLPFADELTVVTMNGTMLKRTLEHSVAKWRKVDSSGQFLQMSGMKVTYDLSLPVGSRVVRAQTECSNCSRTKLADIREQNEYKIIMPAFMANGGDAYTFFEGLPQNILPYDELKCTIDYIGRHNPVNPQITDRITVLNEERIKMEARINKASLGNHELDEGVAGLVPFIRNLSSPVLAANLLLDHVPELQNEPNLHKSIILQIEDTKIGIIGYLTPETRYLAPKNKVEYEDEVLAIRREVEILKRQGVNILIALGHSGYIKDREIARNVEDIDLVIGGHSNTFLWNGKFIDEQPEIPEGPYPAMVTQPSGRQVPVVQAYAYTKYLGKLHLTFNAEGEIIKYDGLPLLLDHEIPNDPELLTTISHYRNEIDRINNEVLGQSLVALDGDCRIFECNMGNLLTDAILEFTAQYHPEYLDVKIAVIQGGRIRTSIDHPGKPMKITRGDLITVLPFSDTLSVVAMNGTVLRKTLEHSVSTWRKVDKTGQFLQMSGMKVTYDLSQPAGSRVVKAQAFCSDCKDLADIKDHYEYKMFMPTFLADGGDGYAVFDGLSKEIVTYDELKSTIYYIGRHSPVKPEVSGRIVLLNEDQILHDSLNINKSDRLVVYFGLQIISLVLILLHV